MEPAPPPTCALCNRAVPALTRHHLIPRTRHKNKRNKRDFSRDEVHERIVWICRPCHSNLHAVLTEKQLERDFNTLESLASHPGVARFTEWIKDKPPGFRVPTHDAHGKARAP